MRYDNKSLCAACARQVFMVISVVAVTLVGCNTAAQSSTPCSHWFMSGLTSIPFDSLNLSNSRAWVSQQFPEIELSSNDKPPIVFWKYERHSHRIVADDDPLQSMLRVTFADQPSVDTIVRCMGEPDRWLVLDLPTPQYDWTQFTLWYFDRGLVFRRTIEAPSARINGDTLIEEFWIIKPRTVTETMATSMYYVPEAVELLKPWPIQQ